MCSALSCVTVSQRLEPRDREEGLKTGEGEGKGSEKPEPEPKKDELVVLAAEWDGVVEVVG